MKGRRDYYIQVLGMLQQRWALIRPARRGAKVLHINDLGEVMRIERFPSEAAALLAIKRRGYWRFSDDPKARDIVPTPSEPLKYP